MADVGEAGIASFFQGCILAFTFVEERVVALHIYDEPNAFYRWDIGSVVEILDKVSYLHHTFSNEVSGIIRFVYFPFDINPAQPAFPVNSHTPLHILVAEPGGCTVEP